MSESDLRAAAVAVLAKNWTGTATLPSPAQYPHQWSWDSAFAAIGWARVDPDRARTELLSLLEGQWRDGRIPHIKFDPELHEDAYFPGPRFWASGTNPAAPEPATSGLVQPPVHARAVWQIVRGEPSAPANRRFLERAYPALTAWHGYLYRRRAQLGTELVPILHPWESGLDNSPLWDPPLARMNLAATEEFVRRDTVNVDASQRPSDRDYRRYVSLAASYRDAGYDDSRLTGHQFVVEDPLFNAVLIDGELCLVRLARLLGLDPSRHEQAARAVSDALGRSLWSDEHGWFGARDVVNGALSPQLTISGLAPLLDPWLGRERRNRTLELAHSRAFAGGCAYPLPSVATDSAAFDRRRYWRGPMWANTNWLVALGARRAGDTSLARAISCATLTAVTREGFREYFDPITGSGLGAHDFTWTAALTIDWLAELADPVRAEPPPVSAP